MIYVTSDTHIPLEINKINTTNFPEQVNLTKDDYLIICGDFGGVWDNGSEEMFWRKWLNERKFTTLFVDGNHENFNLLNKFDTGMWNGGKVHFIGDSIIHLMRGQVFNISGKKFFTMGGAKSVDRMYRIKNKSWWEEEVPSKKELETAMDILDAHNWTVDYVITHTGPLSLVSKHMFLYDNKDPLNKFMEQLNSKLTYKHWYFGHFHQDIKLDSKHTLLYNEIELII